MNQETSEKTAVMTRTTLVSVLDGQDQLDRRARHGATRLQDHRALRAEPVHQQRQAVIEASTWGPSPATRLALPMSSALRNSSPGRGGANSSSGFCFMTLPDRLGQLQHVGLARGGDVEGRGVELTGVREA